MARSLRLLGDSPGSALTYVSLHVSKANLHLHPKGGRSEEGGGGAELYFRQVRCLCSSLSHSLTSAFSSCMNCNVNQTPVLQGVWVERAGRRRGRRRWRRREAEMALITNCHNDSLC